MDKVVIGIDLGGTNIKGGIVDPEGQVLLHKVVPTDAPGGREAVLRRLTGLLEHFAAWCEANRVRPVGVGLGTAGYVEAGSGVVAYASPNLPGWTGLALRDVLAQACGLPVVVANDAHAMALGEAWLGAGKPYTDFLCVTLGTGVGGAVVRGGAIDCGKYGYAGAFGHMTVAFDGQPCNCGGVGCWEQYASVTALRRMAAEAGMSLPRSVDAESVAEAAKRGDDAAVGVYEKYTALVAVGIVNLIHAYNPQAVVIGGAITSLGDFLLEPVRRHIQERALPIYTSVELAAAKLGDAAGVAGAAKLALDRFYQ